MRNKLTPVFSLALAAALQVMPLLRSFVSAETQGFASAGYAFILKLEVGAVALLGFDAVSSASGMGLLPVTATKGVPYTGNIIYVGNQQIANSASVWGNCLYGGQVFVTNGLTFSQEASPHSNIIDINGTPTTNMNLSISPEWWISPYGTATNPCEMVGGLEWPRNGATVTLLISNSPPVVPTWLTTPTNTVAQVGSSVLLSAAASGVPPPSYTWLLGTNPVAVSTQSNLTNDNVQLTDAGLYTVTATNSAGSISTNAYLSVVTVPPNSWLDGSTPLTVTNYQVVGSTLNLSAFITNVPAAQNQYQWEFKYVPVATPPSLVVVNVQTNKSGLFTIILTSTLTFTNGASIATNSLANVEYDSNWQFGHAPAILTQPTNQTASAGGSALFTVIASGDGLMGTHFQWYFNATPLADQTNASLVISLVNTGNVGNYFVTITNVYGAQISSIVSLSELNFPAQPSLTTSLNGSNLQLTWPISSTIFQVQTANSPLGPWTTAALPTTTNGANATMTVLPTNQQQYFRLLGN